MSATNMTIATPKPCMYYDCTYPFTCFKKNATVDTEAIREKQYNYPGAFVSHGECIEAPVDPDIVKLTAADVDLIRKKQYNYPKAIISHGETIEEVPEYVPKKSAWGSFVDFFKQRQKFGRYPFLYTPNI
jgi:hypothetical protein